MSLLFITYIKNIFQDISDGCDSSPKEGDSGGLHGDDAASADVSNVGYCYIYLPFLAYVFSLLH